MVHRRVGQLVNIGKRRVLIPDSFLAHHWESRHGIGNCDVTPDFYEESGTPIDAESGDDMVYVETTMELRALRTIFRELTPEARRYVVGKTIP